MSIVTATKQITPELDAAIEKFLSEFPVTVVRGKKRKAAGKAKQIARERAIAQWIKDTE